MHELPEKKWNTIGRTPRNMARDLGRRLNLNLLDLSLHFDRNLNEMLAPPKRVNKRCPRRNLPSEVGRKRGESTFVLAFHRAFQQNLCANEAQKFLYARELPVTGYGIADFICLRWPSSPETSDPSTSEPNLIQLISFEMKLKDWRRGFAQACRYLFFSHISVLVLPPAEARLASQQVELFQRNKVGLVAFDVEAGLIEKIYWPLESLPRSPRAYVKAIGRLKTTFPKTSKRTLEAC